MPRGRPVRRSLKKRSARQRVQRSRRSTVLAPASSAACSAAVQRSSLRSLTMPAPKRARKRARDLLAHLVAARADRRPDDRRRSRGRGSCAADSTIPSSRPRQPACSDRERGLGTVRPGHGDQRAVGAEGEHRDPGLIRPEPVARSASRAGLGAVDDRGVRLEAERQVLLVGADLGAQAAAVLVHALDLVAGPAPEVERLERALADAAAPRREDDLVRARDRPSGAAGRSRLLDQLPRGFELRLASRPARRSASGAEPRPGSPPLAAIRPVRAARGPSRRSRARSLRGGRRSRAAAGGRRARARRAAHRGRAARRARRRRPA